MSMALGRAGVALTWQGEGHVLQVREEEVLAGPQVAHGGARRVRAGAQLIDHLPGTHG